MGDGGIIAQITDTSSGDVAAAANAAWFSLVVHRAPLNKDCEKDSNPDDDCQFEITEIPTNWARPSSTTTLGQRRPSRQRTMPALRTATPKSHVIRRLG